MITEEEISPAGRYPAGLGCFWFVCYVSERIQNTIRKDVENERERDRKDALLPSLLCKLHHT